MFKKKYRTEIIDFDVNGKYKLTSLFSIIQEVASLGCEKDGISINSLIEKGLMWVILKQRVVMYEDIKPNEVLTFYTYPGKQNKFFYYRHIFAKNKKGKTVLKYISEWAILNYTTRHLALPSETKILLKQESRKDELNEILPIIIEKEEHLEDRKVRFNDIDINSHLNNIKYIEYVLDLNDSNYYKNKDYKEIQFNYLKEVKENEILSFYRSSESPFVVEGKIGDTKMFVSRIIFK